MYSLEIIIGPFNASIHEQEEDNKQEGEDLDELLPCVESRLPTGRRRGNISEINGECRVGRSTQIQQSKQTNQEDSNS